MKVNAISVNQITTDVKEALAKEETVTPKLKTCVYALLDVVEALTQRLNLHSQNSSKPPSSDPNRKKKKSTKKSAKNPGGQPGRVGKQLKLVAKPDRIETIKLDKRRLPKGKYREAGFESRQVVDYEVSVIITEYRAQALIDGHGNRFVAEFPPQAKRPIQYGQTIKGHAVYLSQFQLLPYKRIEDYFIEHMDIALSTGSLFNFNKEAYNLLGKFDTMAKEKLIDSELAHTDETGINMNGKRLWLHAVGNDQWTYLYPHTKRGSEAMDEIGIIPAFAGVLCHDHWKPYYTYTQCKHALCNAHHLRELEWSSTVGGQRWAKTMKNFLEQLNKKVNAAGGKLSVKQSAQYKKCYRRILRFGDSESPNPPRKQGQRGRLKKTKSRNLLERLRNYEGDVLRFIDHEIVPFTNNQGENDLRMTKVQQKISGCFRSMEGAYIFCRVRSYLITCRKHGIGAKEALQILFRGKLPDFSDSS